MARLTRALFCALALLSILLLVTAFTPASDVDFDNDNDNDHAVLSNHMDLLDLLTDEPTESSVTYETHGNAPYSVEQISQYEYNNFLYSTYEVKPLNIQIQDLDRIQDNSYYRYMNDFFTYPIRFNMTYHEAVSRIRTYSHVPTSIVLKPYFRPSYKMSSKTHQPVVHMMPLYNVGHSLNPSSTSKLYDFSSVPLTIGDGFDGKMVLNRTKIDKGEVSQGPSRFFTVAQPLDEFRAYSPKAQNFSLTFTLDFGLYNTNAQEWTKISIRSTYVRAPRVNFLPTTTYEWTDEPITQFDQLSAHFEYIFDYKAYLNQYGYKPLQLKIGRPTDIEGNAHQWRRLDLNAAGYNLYFGAMATPPPNNCVALNKNGWAGTYSKLPDIYITTKCTDQHHCQLDVQGPHNYPNTKTSYTHFYLFCDIPTMVYNSTASYDWRKVFNSVKTNFTYFPDGVNTNMTLTKDQQKVTGVSKISAIIASDWVPLDDTKAQSPIVMSLFDFNTNTMFFSDASNIESFLGIWAKGGSTLATAIGAAIAVIAIILLILLCIALYFAYKCKCWVFKSWRIPKFKKEVVTTTVVVTPHEGVDLDEIPTKKSKDNIPHQKMVDQE